MDAWLHESRKVTITSSSSCQLCGCTSIVLLDMIFMYAVRRYCGVKLLHLIKTIVFLSANLTDKHHSMSFARIDMGQRPKDLRDVGTNRRKLRNANREPARDDSTEQNGGFVGKLQQLIVNKNEMFEMMRTGGVRRVDMTATSDIGNGGLNFPLTFRTPDAYVLTKLKIYSTFEIYLQVGEFLTKVGHILTCN